MEQGHSFKQILKATSLFGGVQVFNILISMVRSKFIALFIGPLGMGISSLLLATIGVLNAITNLGLDRSAVKEISFAKENKSEHSIERSVGVLEKLVWITSLGGTFIMILASPLLSKLAFGNDDYVLHIGAVSAALFFNQLTQGKLAILQGLRQLKGLAKANLWGNFIGLLITVPLYYYFRIDAIVPAIIIAAALSFVITFYYNRVHGVSHERLSSKEAIKYGKPMIHLGVMLSLSSIITLIVAYIIQVFISASGGVDEVGLYNAGFLIMNTYVGLVFTAMGTDYFPRLSAIANDREKTNKAVFEQAYIAVLLIVPIITIFLAFAPQFIAILYTKAFSPIIGFVSWGILGMLFKAVSFSMGYMLIAKGDSKLFIRTAIGFNSLLLIANVIGYTYGGLNGLGISFFGYYIVHYAALHLLTRKVYRFSFDSSFYPVFLISILICVLAYIFSQWDYTLGRYLAMGVIIIISCLFSLYLLDKKIDLKQSIQKFLKR
jgi:O-antigen/teichoic acid export membrane protein